MSTDTTTGLQLRSLIKKSGELEISLANVPTPEPAEDQIVVRVEASPINPSDLGLLVGAADMATAKASGTKEAPVITAKVPDAAMKAMAGRLDESMPVGNEGAGVVVATGSSGGAQAVDGQDRRHDLRRRHRDHLIVPAIDRLEELPHFGEPLHRHRADPSVALRLGE